MTEKLFNNRFKEKHIGKLFRFAVLPVLTQVKILDKEKCELLNYIPRVSHGQTEQVLLYIGNRTNWNGKMKMCLFIYEEMIVGINTVDFYTHSFIQVSE